ncbi:chromatin assembly factor 1 subunit A-domain-containing protein [Mycena metata]|uniref:Chromatin assembly factor 1 subunit A-domain-containing protein n=1 Tax=Mycena metata TaxID=1033252 RepID=A0AAD7NAV1_9AGAR|nr:chromatin assembly factor 1 subunit A-domain-containing protein [Mycena metata]
MSCDAQQASTQAGSITNGAVPEKSSIVDLKNGKIVFKQKSISFEKHSETLQEIVKFREMLEERISRREDALPSIPDEYKPVVAKLAHESDKTLSALSKHILQELLPVQDEDDEQNMPPPLTLPVVESVKAPAAVCVWRWEAKPAHLDWLPKNAREKAENRIAERAKSDLKSLFDSLPKDEQVSILDPKGTAKASVKDAASTSNAIDLTGDDTKSPAPPKKKKDNEENDSTTAPKVSRPKKIVDSDKTAKEKEKQEKKAAKTEREQKEKDAQKKSQSLMQNFLKSKATTPRAVLANPASAEASVSNVSQFDKTFKPFVVKKDTTVAPINWFTTSQNTSRPPLLTYDGDIIIVDDADDVKPATPMDVSGMSAKDRLRSALHGLPSGPSARTRLVPGARDSASAGLKTRSSVSVRDMIAQLNEAEVSGDVNLVRSLLTQLSDRDIVPAKVFIFADDARPGYFGTWTRNSRIIGPRTPFARDVAVFDYGYDSGEEWEEEPAGDADDVIDDGEDEDGEVEDADSDLDSWLVDDEDEPETPQTPAGSRGGSPVFSSSRAPIKRKAEATEDPKLAKKRKVVVPLVPFAKGPVWEQTIGRCEYNMFNPYRIQLFNDTPFPIDPFTFVMGLPSRLYPDRLVAANPTQPDTSPVPSVAPTKRAALAPKTVFPDIHLTHLLNKITTSSTASLPILIDTIYQDLKDQKVKKNSIEAKVREVAEKCKVKKVWIVKENFRVGVQGA